MPRRLGPFRDGSRWGGGFCRKSAAFLNDSIAREAMTGKYLKPDVNYFIKKRIS